MGSCKACSRHQWLHARPIHGVTSRMHKDACIGQLCEPPMLIVGVREVEDGNNFF